MAPPFKGTGCTFAEPVGLTACATAISGTSVPNTTPSPARLSARRGDKPSFPAGARDQILVQRFEGARRYLGRVMLVNLDLRSGADPPTQIGIRKQAA